MNIKYAILVLLIKRITQKPAKTLQEKKNSLKIKLILEIFTTIVIG